MGKDIKSYNRPKHSSHDRIISTLMSAQYYLNLADQIAVDHPNVLPTSSRRFLSTAIRYTNLVTASARSKHHDFCKRHGIET